MESWGSKDCKHDNSFDYEDAKDLPIELRRIEDIDDILDPPLSSGLKSQSLGSILNVPNNVDPLVRSQSSVPSLSTEELAETMSCQTGSTPSLSLVAPTNSYASMESLGGRAPSGIGGSRPKLVKQKQSLQEDVEYPAFDGGSRVEMTTMTTVVGEASSEEAKEAAAFKEILTSVKDTRIQFLRKQSSLNEELMAESRIREKERIRKRIQKQTSLNETFLCRSVITKRLQVIREGFTTKLKTSTGSLERVTKNGFVKIMQNIKIPNPNQFVNIPTKPHSPKQQQQHNNSNPLGRTNSEGKTLQPLNPEEERARRHSRESGSDSSKESSLQSDTSIESEDSFASVIYIPKPEQLQQMNSSFDYTLTMNPNRIPSVPTSPLVFPCPTPAHSPAPPRCKQPTSGACSKETIHFSFEQAQIQKADDLLLVTKMNNTSKVTSPPLQSAPPVPASTPKTPPVTTTTLTPRITRDDIRNLPPIPKYPPAVAAAKQAARQTSFPIVRRMSSAPIVPKLKSLELFNPATDDLDSDSSEPSSPDSVDSVISATKISNDVTLPDVIVNKEETVEMVIRERRMHLDHGGCDMETDENARRKHLVDFAEKLSAQLLKELEAENTKNNSRDNQTASDEDPYLRKLNNGEAKDFNQLRKELRERRLMLADLSHYGSHEDEYNKRRYHDLIPEEENEDERPDTALIPESPEDNDEDAENGDTLVERNKEKHNFVNRLRKQRVTTNNNSIIRESSSGATTTASIRSTSSSSSTRQPNTEWTHSTSTASLDSPSVGGGSATHHRYFHVFREGELDTLINHHVASLHIVSSYYERASWCVVAEKVQVWTI